MIDLLREKGIDIADRHMDCGIEIFDAEAQDTHAGGSGCGCSAVTLAAYILPKLESGEWKKSSFYPPAPCSVRPVSTKVKACRGSHMR